MSGNAARVVLSLGANLGDRRTTLQHAVNVLRIEAFGGEIHCSSVYETEPVGYREQPAFYNIACAGETFLTPSELFAVCRSIERRLGRRERPRWHEREIDIDILLYDNIIFADELLQIPHPRMLERAFVLIPAAEIVPEMQHPVTGTTLRELASNCGDKAEVKLITNQVISV